MKRNSYRLPTQLVHAGEPHIGGAVAMPVFQSSTYLFEGQESYHDLRYIRLNNTPNHAALHAKLATLESAEAALAAASGMAAISTTLLSLLKAGDHLLIQDCLYGGTLDLAREFLPEIGVEVSFVDGAEPAQWEAALRDNTRALYLETLSNPLVQLADLEQAVAFARRHALISIVDNTFASPVNFRPCEQGFDLSLHSATKYLNGHSDIVAGAVLGRGELIERIRHRLNLLGGSLDPHAAFLLQRGLKTLALRVRCQNHNALALAQLLDAHPAVARVNYPGLEGHPQHARAARLLDGGGGMLSFELHDGHDPDAVIERLRLALSAPSLGGPETLVTRPATTSHAGMPAAARQRIGIGDGLVRVSVGIEAIDDLREDFSQALAPLT